MSTVIINRDEFTKALTQELYLVDPAETQCNLNDITDEYINEARYVAGLFVENDMPFKLALFEVFDESFDGHYDVEKLNRVFVTINERIC